MTRQPGPMRTTARGLEARSRAIAKLEVRKDNIASARADDLDVDEYQRFFLNEWAVGERPSAAIVHPMRPSGSLELLGHHLQRAVAENA